MEWYFYIALGLLGLFILFILLRFLNLFTFGILGAPITVRQRNFVKNSNNKKLNSWERGFMYGMKSYVKKDKELSFKQNIALNRIINKVKGKPKESVKSKTKIQEKPKTINIVPKTFRRKKPIEQELKPRPKLRRKQNPLEKILSRTKIIKPKRIPEKPIIKESDESKELRQNYKKSLTNRENARARMQENKQLYEEFLSYNQYEKLPKGSQMKWLEIAELMRKIKENSSDYKSDPILDDLDIGLEYSENLEIVNEKYPSMKDKQIKSIINDEKIKEKREFLEDYYITMAEKHPSRAIKDSQEANPPIKRIIPNDKINKRWLKDPFSKTGGDYEGIDDGSEPIFRDDFSDSTFLNERKLNRKANSEHETKYLTQGKKTDKHFRSYLQSKDRYGKDHKTTEFHHRNYRSSVDKQQIMLDKHRERY